METEKRVELPPPRDRPTNRHAAATVRPLGDGSRIGNVRRGGHFIARRDRLLQAATNFGLIQKSLAARVFQKPYCCAASLGTTTASPRHAITSHGAMADGSRARWIGTYSAGPGDRVPQLPPGVTSRRPDARCSVRNVAQLLPSG
mgnify:CR=1 FL=1